MPRNDGADPADERSGSDRRGRGRMRGDRAGAGPAGNCVCPRCGERVPHKAGSPCNRTVCPECGMTMTRE